MMPRVLIVDDDARVRETLQDIIEDRGYTVACASDGRAALEMLQASSTSPCVIVLDLVMPVMTGGELLTIMRSDERLGQIPVVTVSALTDPGEHAGHVRHLKKPVHPRILLSTVSELCPC